MYLWAGRGEGKGLTLLSTSTQCLDIRSNFERGENRERLFKQVTIFSHVLGDLLPECPCF